MLFKNNRNSFSHYGTPPFNLKLSLSTNQSLRSRLNVRRTEPLFLKKKWKFFKFKVKYIELLSCFFYFAME